MKKHISKYSTSKLTVRRSSVQERYYRPHSARSSEGAIPEVESELHTKLIPEFTPTSAPSLENASSPYNYHDLMREWEEEATAEGDFPGVDAALEFLRGTRGISETTESTLAAGPSLDSLVSQEEDINLSPRKSASAFAKSSDASKVDSYADDKDRALEALLRDLNSSSSSSRESASSIEPALPPVAFTAAQMSLPEMLEEAAQHASEASFLYREVFRRLSHKGLLNTSITSVSATADDKKVISLEMNCIRACAKALQSLSLTIENELPWERNLRSFAVYMIHKQLVLSVGKLKNYDEKGLIKRGYKIYLQGLDKINEMYSTDNGPSNSFFQTFLSSWKRIKAFRDFVSYDGPITAYTFFDAIFQTGVLNKIDQLYPSIFVDSSSFHSRSKYHNKNSRKVYSLLPKLFTIKQEGSSSPTEVEHETPGITEHSFDEEGYCYMQPSVANSDEVSSVQKEISSLDSLFASAALANPRSYTPVGVSGLSFLRDGSLATVKGRTIRLMGQTRRSIISGSVETNVVTDREGNKTVERNVSITPAQEDTSVAGNTAQEIKDTDESLTSSDGESKVSSSYRTRFKRFFSCFHNLKRGASTAQVHPQRVDAADLGVEEYTTLDIGAGFDPKVRLSP